MALFYVWLMTVFSMLLMLTHTTTVSGCAVTEDCANDEVCKDKTCIDPCQINPCGKDTLCFVKDHLVQCACKDGFMGHPFTGCYPDQATTTAPPGCTSHDNCPNDKICNGGTCTDPCLLITCGPNTACKASDHTATCSFQVGNTWNPTTEHVPSVQLTNKKKYIVYNGTKRTWQEAFDHCKSRGMNLATINNEEEQDMVFNLIRIEADLGPWIGATDLGDGKYRWKSTNTPITYRNWASGEPDNEKCSDGEVEHCVYVWSNTGKWFDEKCSNVDSHICEQYES